MVARPRRVLAATDLSGEGDATIAWVSAIAAGPIEVRFVHVVDQALYPSPLYAHYRPGTTPTPEERAKQIADLEARLRAMVPADAAARGLDVTVEILEGDDVAGVLCDCAEKMDADLIVLGSHRRHPLAEVLLGSVENNVLRKSGRAVLLVPTEKATEKAKR